MPSKEITEKVLDFYKNDPSLSRTEIAERLGIKLSMVKTILSKENITKDMNIRQSICYKAKIAKNPLAMQEMRLKLTDEVIAKRTAKVREAYSQPELLSKIREIRAVPREPILSKYKWSDVLKLSELNKVYPISNPDPDQFIESISKLECAFRCFCGNIFVPRVMDFIYNKINSCGCVKSKYENDIREMIRGWGLEVIGQDRQVIAPYELDIVVPEQKIAIEYCGLYYHGEHINKEKAKMRHINKMRLAEKAGYRLITIFSDEWILKQEQVISFLKSILGKSKNRLGARKTRAAKISVKEANEFLEKYHLMGRSGNITYGLYCGHDLVAVCSFKRSSPERKGIIKDGFYELTRFCIKPDYHITGSLGKFLSVFENEFKPKTVVSYSDSRWSVGGVYINNGFILTNELPPSYWYFKKSTDHPRFHKALFRKEKIIKKYGGSAESTEHELSVGAGFDRIYDCGLKRWEKQY